jgi:hypothetical protein
MRLSERLKSHLSNFRWVKASLQARHLIGERDGNVWMAKAAN